MGKTQKPNSPQEFWPEKLEKWRYLPLTQSRLHRGKPVVQFWTCEVQVSTGFPGRSLEKAVA